MSNSFTATSGSWDNSGNWSGGTPTSNSYNVTIGTNATLVAAAGTDVFAGLQLTGTAAGGSGNTLDVTGTLSDTGNNSGISAVTDFTFDIANGASFTAPSIGGLTNSLLDVGGVVNLFGGGGISAITGSAITIESTGTLVAAQLKTDGTDTLIVKGVLDLTGGGNGLGATHVTINSGGIVTVSGTDDETGVWNVNGGTYIGAGNNNQYPTSSFNFNGIAGGMVELPTDQRYGDSFTISSFATGDTLILGSIAAGTPLTTQLNGTDLTILSGDNVVAEVLHFTDVSGTALGAHVVHGQITLDGCFCAGTNLATPDGAIAVEDITAGTVLRTASGEARPVRWLGRSSVSTKFRDPLRAFPIRIKAGALGDNLPLRDLLVSPCHAMLLGGVLIHAGALVNGETIIRETDVPEKFIYFHVELDSHDLLLAEGAAAESFVDNIDRMHFENWAEHEQLDGAPMPEMAYPRAKSARQIPMAVRAMLGVRQAA